MTTAGPAAAYYQGDLYVAWKGATTDHVGYAAYNGSSWAPQQTVSGSWGTALTTSTPALAVYDGDLYAAWTGANGNDIYYSAYNGSAWTAQQTISGSWGSAGTNAGAVLMVFDGDLYAGWRGTTSGHIYYSAYNGTAWAPQVGLSPTSADAPALVADPIAPGLWVIAWTTSNEAIDYIYCLGTGAGACSGPVSTLHGAATNASPALAFMGGDTGTLYFAWKDATGDQIGYEASFDNAGFTPRELEPQALTSAAPALAVGAYTLYTAWKGNGTNQQVWFAAANTPY